MIAPYELLPDLWPKERIQQPQLFSQLFTYLHKKLDKEGLTESFWYPEDPHLFSMLHRFKWLCEFRDFVNNAPDDMDCSEKKAESIAQKAIMSWACMQTFWKSASWEPCLLAQRISHWVMMREFFLGMTHTAVKSCILDSVVRQTHHLSSIISHKTDPSTLLLLSKGLAYGSLYCSQGRQYRQRVLRIVLERVSPQLTLSDGGCVERNPYNQYTHLLHFLEIYVLLKGLKEDIPKQLVLTIAKMTQVLQLFLHDDKKLCLFNGSHEGDAHLFEHMIKTVQSSIRPPISTTRVSSTPKMKFERLSNHCTVVIADVGSPSMLPFVESVHAGTLSFEMSHKKQRIVVNCGTPPWYMKESKQQERRSTAAHSTLILGHTNSIDLSTKLTRNSRYPKEVTSRKYTYEQGDLKLEATHDGYFSNFGYLHARKITLDKDGDKLCGEDRVFTPHSVEKPSRKNVKPVLYFHLHPDVVPEVLCMTTQNVVSIHNQSFPKTKVQLCIKDTDMIWEFIAPNHDIQLEQSQYWGTGTAQETKQIIVSEPQGDSHDMIFRWMFYKCSQPGS